MNSATLAAAPLAVLALASAASGQAVYQQQPNKAVTFAGDTLARYEWTRNVPSGGELVNLDRYRVQLRPRLELRFGPIELGAGGEFNYSDDENDVPPEGEPLLIIRDNYRSRDARLDLAYLKLTLGPLTAQGGRFLMPIPFTEMIWDRDLRPQGGAASVTLGEATSPARLALHGIYAQGSHVFDDEGDYTQIEGLNPGSTEMFGGAAELSLGRAGESQLHVMGAYLQYDTLNGLEPAIRRQNNRVAGLIAGEYHVWDVVGRLTRGGQLPLQLVVDYCWNSEFDQDNKGLWFTAVIGATGVSRGELAYTYAKLDKNATLAAYNSDDFFWGTGWEGHRIDLGLSTTKKNSVHGIAQWQRFKDSPDPNQQEEWVTRYRLEWRTRF